MKNTISSRKARYKLRMSDAFVILLELCKECLTLKDMHIVIFIPTPKERQAMMKEIQENPQDFRLIA